MGEKMRTISTIRSAIAVFAVALGLLVSARAAQAQYDSGGFEPPRFLTDLEGSPELSGQDPQGPWLKDSGAGSAIIQTAVKQSGTQAVQFTRPANINGDTRYAVPRTTPLAGAPGTIVRVNWDMNVSLSPTAPFGPFFGAESYDATTPAIPRLIGSLGVDSHTGELLYQDADGILTPTGDVVPFGQWNHYTLELNYDTKQYTGFLNGAAVVTSPFIDPGITGFTDAPISALASDAASLATATGTAYFDNYSITVVPEPAGLALVGLGSLALIRRRRTVVA
jgi:MYXO-CTERM domain-containing protein